MDKYVDGSVVTDDPGHLSRLAYGASGDRPSFRLGPSLAVSCGEMELVSIDLRFISFEFALL